MLPAFVRVRRFHSGVSTERRARSAGELVHPNGLHHADPMIAATGTSGHRTFS
ncbi:Uncharacterised protein [Amycolatopsis camponoti]|uniref:Uncharacterized protein n=1 Tax=Amycolatopsis camponoti TaxID=2606593 RepID=A0A6I8LPP9_9PSEU|nr:Uncharacterised protein [Amycolatopsis camponoti]